MSHPKIALVTGGAKRVGREICLYLAEQGYDIAVHYNTSKDAAFDTVAACKERGVNATAIQGELTVTSDCTTIIHQCVQTLGTPTLLVHNASRFDRDTLETLDEEQLHRHMSVHCYAPLFLAQAWHSHIAEHDVVARQLIMLGDGLEHWSLSPAFLSYAISKDAMHAVVKRLAETMAPHMRVNLIACGVTLAGEIDTAEMIERFKTLAPLPLASSPQEVCQTIDFLERTPTITGQSIALNSGMHLYHNKATNRANTAT